MDHFLDTLGDLLAILVFLGVMACLAFGAWTCYKLGYSQRIKLEKRAAVFEAAELKRQVEDEEIAQMEKRKRELGRT